MDANFNLVWMTSLFYRPTIKGMSIDVNENSVCIAGNPNPIVAACIFASNGAVFNSIRISTISGANNEVRAQLLDDNSGYYLVGIKIAINKANICLILFDTPNSAECQDIPSMSFQAYGFLMFSKSQFFILGNDNLAPYNLYFYKITFGNTAVDLASIMSCPSGVCSAFYSENVLSNDATKIYSLFIYGATQYLFIVPFNATDLTVIGTIYKSSISLSSVGGSLLKGDYILAGFNSASVRYLLVYNTLTYSVTAYLTNGASFSQLAIQPSTGRIISVSSYNSKGYITLYYLGSISWHPDISSIASIFSVLSPGSYDITSQIGATISTTTIESVTSPGYTNQSVTYIINAIDIYNSDVLYQLDDQTFSVSEGNTLQVTPNLPCSSSGSSSLDYTLSQYNQEAIPSWITLEISTGLLNISAPSVTADTNYRFYISTYTSGALNSLNNSITLYVLNCIDQNCQRCSNTDVTICEVCILGYDLTSSNCIIHVVTPVQPTTSTSQQSPQQTQTSTSQVPVQPSSVSNYSSNPTQEGKTYRISFQTLTMIACIISLLASMMSLSTMSSIWSMINQLQLFFLLLLTGVYIPVDVVTVIAGARFAIYPFDYIPFETIGLYSIGINNFNFDILNSNLISIGIKSDSSIYNIYPFLLSILIIFIIHLFVIIAQKYVLVCETCEECTCLLKCSKYITNKLFIFFTFGYYIRTLLEVNQYMLISSINEINEFNVSSRTRTISLIFAFLSLVFCLSIIGTAIYLLFSSYIKSENNHNKIGEFLLGLKDKEGKLYSLLLLVRRFIFVAILIVFASKSPIMVIAVLCCLQLIYLIYLIILRPFDETKSNVIEIMNELYFTGLLGCLIRYNTEARWNHFSTTLYISILLSNSIANVIITLIDMIRNARQKCRNKSSTTNLNRRIHPVELNHASQIETQIKEYNLSNAKSVSETNRNQATTKKVRKMNEENKYAIDENMPSIQIFKFRSLFVDKNNSNQNKNKRF